MRDTTVDMLSAMGHHAMSAGDAYTALSILTSNPIDVLLTDVGLPDMPGPTLASHAKSRFPSLQCDLRDRRGVGRRHHHARHGPHADQAVHLRAARGCHHLGAEPGTHLTQELSTMGRLIFAMMQSLDGYVAGAAGGPGREGYSADVAAGVELPPPGAALGRHFNEHVRGLAGSLYGTPHVRDNALLR